MTCCFMLCAQVLSLLQEQRLKEKLQRGRSLMSASAAQPHGGARAGV